MTRAIYYPPANRTARWYNDSFRGADIEPNVTVWHTTETGGVPSYGGGASAPTLTYDPEAHEWFQHFRLDRSARALRNPSGGVETNTLNACQLELVCYSDENLAAERGHLAVSDLDDEALRDLGEFSRFMHDEWGMRLDIDPGWEYGGDRSPERMTFSEWRSFYGHTGHNRVPEQTHWDPGRLDIDTIIANARGANSMDADEVYNATWRQDRMRAPGPYEDSDNDVWMPESILRGAWNHAWRGNVAIRDQVVPLLQQIRAAQGGAERDQVLEDIQAELQAAHAEREAIGDLLEIAAQRDAQLLALATRIVEGGPSVDAQAVAREIIDLFHERTAPDAAE